LGLGWCRGWIHNCLSYETCTRPIKPGITKKKTRAFFRPLQLVNLLADVAGKKHIVFVLVPLSSTSILLSLLSVLMLAELGKLDVRPPICLGSNDVQFTQRFGLLASAFLGCRWRGSSSLKGGRCSVMRVCTAQLIMACLCLLSATFPSIMHLICPNIACLESCRMTKRRPFGIFPRCVSIL
jgi:hypothetical protein